MYYTNEEIFDASEMISIIQKSGDEVFYYTQKPTLQLIKDMKIDFIVSDRSRYLITQDIIDYLPRKIVNLHPSYLPWNRGYFPNYWSIKNGTPHGVTLHYVDAGIDSGDIIAQTRLFYTKEDTLRTTYERLRKTMVTLFETFWDEVRTLNSGAYPQDITLGDIHYKHDFNGIYDSLLNGWDTKVTEI